MFLWRIEWAYTLRLLEAAVAAIGYVEAFQGEIPTPLARCLSVTFNLPSLAFRTSNRDIAIPLGAWLRR